MFVGSFFNRAGYTADVVSEFILVKKIYHAILSTENVKRAFVFLTTEAGRAFGVWKNVFPFLLA